MSGRTKHIGYLSQINLCRTADRKSHTNSRGNIKFVVVTLAGSQHTICSYHVGLSSTWHFYEKSRELGLEFRVSLKRNKKKENRNTHTTAPVNRRYVLSIWSLTLVSTLSIDFFLFSFLKYPKFQFHCP